MLATMVTSERPSADELQRSGWIYELKLDGVRIIAERHGTDVALAYRSARTATPSYPEVVRALRELGTKDFVLDGEVITFDKAGRPSFQRLGQRIGLDRDDDVARAEREVPVLYVVFDVLSVDGQDVRGLPLTERRAIVEAIVPSAAGTGIVRTLEWIPEDGRALFDMCVREGLEGVIAKRADSVYASGARSRDWVKLKARTDDDFVVVGFTRGERGREALGALDLATYDGATLTYRGKVGSGLDDRTIDALKLRLAALTVSKTSAKGAMLSAPRGRTFVKPELVVSVRYGGWSDDGHLRHPVFLGVRDDIAPIACTARAPVMAETETLADYYASVAAVLLPYLRGREVAAAGTEKRRVSTATALRKLGAPITIVADEWAAFDADVNGAHALHALLDAIGLPAFVRVGERTAVQVLVPLGAEVPKNTSAAFALLVAGLLAPARVTPVSAGPILAPYSPTSRANVLVSAPLTWDEVTARLEPSLFTRDKIKGRLERLGDPMGGLLTARVDFLAAVAKLEGRVNAR